MPFFDLFSFINKNTNPGPVTISMEKKYNMYLRASNGPNHIGLYQ